MSSPVRRFRETGDKELLRAFYSRPEYARLYRGLKQKWRAKFEILQWLMAPASGQKVLDVGCGGQLFRPFVEETGAVYRCVDLAPSFEPDYLCDAETLEGVPSDAFDWVVLADVLEHLPNPAAALRAARRVGRRVLTVVPNWYHLERLTFLPRDPNDRHLVRMPPRRWLEAHVEAGWSIDHVRGFFYVPSVAFKPWYPLRLFDNLAKRVLHRLSRPIDRYLADRPVLRYSAQELIVLGSRAPTAERA